MAKYKFYDGTNWVELAQATQLGSYLPLSGGTSPVHFNADNLPQFSGSIPYLVGIESFSDGGTLKWQSASDVSVGYASSSGNADTVDGEHATAFAHIGVGNNLVTAGNEFNFISDNYGGNDGADVWINYTTPSRDDSAKITGYILGNGHGGQLGTIIHSGNIGSQSVDYANTAGSAPASDVYSWAKQPSKPNYNFSEIQPGNITMGDGNTWFRYRTNSSLEAGFYYHNYGDESAVFANMYSHAGWIFANGVKPSDMTQWTSLSPAMQIKDNSVAINKLWTHEVRPSYNLDVNGSANATTVTVNTHVTMQYNSNEDCLDFVFA